jgi:cyclic pyranopterin phosphate synthase
VTTRILHKVLPNLSQLVRIKGQRRFSIHSRGVAGVRGKTVIVNLPGTPGGISDSLSALLPWLFKSLPHREEQ